MSAISLGRDNAFGCGAGSPSFARASEDRPDPAVSPDEAGSGDPARHRRTAPSPELRAKITPIARSLLGLISLYRHSLSPVLPVVCGPGCGCRFHPTCAVYATEAVRTFGAVRGSWLAARRLLKCAPWHPGGFDPIPAGRPVAKRVTVWARPAPAPVPTMPNSHKSGHPSTAALQPVLKRP